MPALPMLRENAGLPVIWHLAPEIHTHVLGCCSGMLPGYVSGFYTHDECHVDLNRLARYAGAALVLDAAVGLDLQARSPSQVVPFPVLRVPFMDAQIRNFHGPCAAVCLLTGWCIVSIPKCLVHQVLPLCRLYKQVVDRSLLKG